MSGENLMPILGDEGHCAICREARETTLCARQWVCLDCHASVRLAYACLHMTLPEAIRRNEEREKREDMAARKTTTSNAATPAGIPKGAVARDRYEEKLPCKSEDSVIAAKALELAKLEHQRTVFRASWKAQCAKARERRAYFEERIEELASEVSGEVEMRNVEVQEYLLPTNEVIAVRLDTAEIVSRRTADAEDLQDRIPGAEGGKKKRGGKTEKPAADEAAEDGEG